jgi:hypothetical protein
MLFPSQQLLSLVATLVSSDDYYIGLDINL